VAAAPDGGSSGADAIQRLAAALLLPASPAAVPAGMAPPAVLPTGAAAQQPAPAVAGSPGC
jgi:hypothetical protein